MDNLLDRFMIGVKNSDTDVIMDCIWPDSRIISVDFPPLTYDSYLTELQPLIFALDDIKFEFVYKTEYFASVMATITVSDRILYYYITGLADSREGVLKFQFIHFSPCQTEAQMTLAWIARKLDDLEEIGAFRFQGRLQLQAEVARLETANQVLTNRLNRNHNLIATGRVTALNRNTNPPIFKLVNFNLNQSFLIPVDLLNEIGLKNDMLVRVTESRPVAPRSKRGQTRLWMVEAIERVVENPNRSLVT